MNCSKFREELKNWLECRLPGEDEREFLEKSLSEEFFIHARNCKSCCSLFEGAMLLLNGKKLRVQPPLNLYTKIEKSLEQAYQSHEEAWAFRLR